MAPSCDVLRATEIDIHGIAMWSDKQGCLKQPFGVIGTKLCGVQIERVEGLEHIIHLLGDDNMSLARIKPVPG